MWETREALIRLLSMLRTKHAGRGRLASTATRISKGGVYA